MTVLPPAFAVAVVWMLAALACFATLDTVTKVLALSAPLAMALWCRFVFQAMVATLLCAPRRARMLLRTRHPTLHLARGISLIGCSLFAFLSLQHMPVGELTAIAMLCPLVITLLGARAAGQRVGARRWALLLGGLAGAWLIIRPGTGMLGWAAVLPLALLACNTLYQWVTSRLSRLDDANTMQFYTGWIGVLLSSLLLPWGWHALPAATWGLLGAAGALGTLGHVMLIQAYRRAAADRLAPLLYVQIGFATLASWWVFDHAPDLLAWAGLLAIAVCGAGSALLWGRQAALNAA